MKNLVFYKDTLINKEIAYILNIEYVYIEDLNSKDLIFIEKNKDEQKALEKGMILGKDYINLNYICDYLDNFNRPWEIYYRQVPLTRNLEEIEKINSKELALSEMLIKVLYSKPKDIDCKSLNTEANIDFDGNVWGCCPSWITKPFGNVLNDKDVYNNYYAKIIKLSELNKTYCFCNLANCKYYDKLNLKEFKVEFPKRDYPINFSISHDKTCNLCCNSCRTCYYKPTDEQKAITRFITNKIIESGWLEKSEIFLAGQGELFLSEEYQKILKELKSGRPLKILSNGTLFTEKKWQYIEDNFYPIRVEISIDASTSETYNKLRHGNFEILIKNLENLGSKRKENKLQYFQFNFVVQRENMNEMKEFIQLARNLNVDKIQFTKLNNWNTTTEEEYKNNCLIIDDYLDYELYELLQDPVFQDEIVNLESLENLIKNSKKYYEK